MASKLCCTAEQEGRPDSPQLPNARLTGATPAKQPLLLKLHESPNSRFTSFRTDELHELHQIFDHAQNHSDEQPTPPRVSRARFSRASVYSLHSLHKITSMRSLIKRKFSRDLVKKQSTANIDVEAAQNVVMGDQDTVVKNLKTSSKQKLQITKENLRKDLLSDKRPDEGGYDSDAQVLDNLARNIGKKTPSKRASIHSVRWSSATGSKATPDSSTKSRDDGGCDPHEMQPYQIQKPLDVSLSTRISHVFSTPNLRVDVSDGTSRAFRRSQSAMSIGLPQVSPMSPLSPLRLPSLTSHDQNGVTWAEAINESLRLSQFPAPPCHVSSGGTHDRDAKIVQRTTLQSRPEEKIPRRKPTIEAGVDAIQPVEIRVEQRTSAGSPRPSTSIRSSFPEPSQPLSCEETDVDELGKEDNARNSVHLYSMRISHHLRSGSLLSWDQLHDAPELPTSTQRHRYRTVSDQSRTSQMTKQTTRHERQTSSSGFASSKVPYKWGKVLPKDHEIRGDMASSIYSSRPQSPPDSLIASRISLSRMNTVHDDVNSTPIQLSRIRRSNSFPTDNEETPRAAPRYGPSNLRTVQGAPTTEHLLAAQIPLARKNSVADTKKSKFHEDFSPSPPRKRINPSESIAKLLNFKRLSGRSQSEATLIARSLAHGGDATVDSLNVPNNRERRQSQSRVSFEVEQRALSEHKGADRVWDQALKAHQEEKASLFLPVNRDLAAHASPFRERSGSIMTGHSANESTDPITKLTLETQNQAEGLFASSYSPRYGPNEHKNEESTHPPPIARRSAMVNEMTADNEREISVIFEKQGDTPDIVGAWGRYPSHTRNERTNSAGNRDRVDSRDFALEAAIKFASAHDVEEDMIDPIGRMPSMLLTPGDKRKKKKATNGRMAKSNSMTFGKKFLKNYSNLFKSSSTEFRTHGRNHRSSVVTGGVLEFPELELLPEVGNHRPSFDGCVESRHRRKHSLGTRRASDCHPTEKLQTQDSMATLRPRRNSSAPNLNVLAHDSANEDKHSKDNARVWSVYYDDCVPSYPRVSIELNAGLKESCSPRFSFESQHPSLRSRTMPRRSVWHSRNTSHMSYTSVTSRGSVRPSFKSRSESDDLVEKRSIVSVRRSTMDLISKFKEQEMMAHEKVLSMTRAGSRYESEALAAL